MVNICMIVKDRPRHTGQALNSLISNTDPRSYDLTVIDDCSELANADALCDQVGKMVQIGISAIVFPNTKVLGVGGSKNRAVEMCQQQWGRSDFLYLSDNDVYFTPNWLDILICFYVNVKRPGVRLIGGQNHPYLHPNKQLWYSPLTKREVHSYDAIAGCSWLMEWSTWDKYGPLDSHAKGVRQSEDVKFCQDIIKDGGLVAAINPPVVIDCGKTDTFGEKVPGNELYQDVEGIWRG